MRTTTLSETKSDYLEQVSYGLSDLGEEDREEILQDLAAHLAELPDHEIIDVLGEPESFVAEFRTSAGLNQAGRISMLIGTVRGRLDEWTSNLSRLTHWPMVRPVWIWTRGWLVVSLFATTSGGVTFRRFPIPAVGESTAMGLAWVAAATGLSVWLDRQRRHPVRDIASSTYTIAGILALAIGVLSPISLEPTSHSVVDDVAYSPEGLIGPGGKSVTNIYAYDQAGNQVEVLLFDQDGQPLLSLPTWVYEEAERNPGQETIEYSGRAIAFPRDRFGRITPNLYPLRVFTHDQSGGLTPISPPNLGASQDESRQPDTPVPTTVSSFDR